MEGRVWRVLIVSLYFFWVEIAESVITPVNSTYFIETSCSNTTYPVLCFNTLSPYAESIGSDYWNLCTSALNATISSSRAAASKISAIARRQKGGGGGISQMEAAVVADCVENIRDSIDQMKQSLKAIKRIVKDNNNRAAFDFHDQMDNIKTWISAAITDDGTCTDGFAGTKLGEAVKTKIRRCVVYIGRLTSNALSLINHHDQY